MTVPLRLALAVALAAGGPPLSVGCIGSSAPASPHSDNSGFGLPDDAAADTAVSLEAGPLDSTPTEADAAPDDGCRPQTCQSLNQNCGLANDGCNGLLECGTCTPPEYCGGGGGARCGGDAADSGVAETPATCQSLGYTCGMASDGFGGVLDCGTCTSPEYCGGAGYDKCGGGGPPQCLQDLCVPVTCTDFDCGLAGDGCGGVLECGPCPFSESCVNNQCLWPADAGPCAAARCAGLGYDCGPTSDGCGGHLECGTCPVSQFCGGGGAHRCGGTCETPDGGDPCHVTCSSPDGGTCEGLSCLASGYSCGEAPNGCGGLINCGACRGDSGSTDAPSEAAGDAQADARAGG